MNNVNKQKKILLLGGLRYLLPVIKAAHDLGYYVITCDYLPDNIAHKYADEYHNVSIIDKEAVLALARELQIDGIMSFAVDPGVVTLLMYKNKWGYLLVDRTSPYVSYRIKIGFALFCRNMGLWCLGHTVFLRKRRLCQTMKYFLIR